MSNTNRRWLRFSMRTLLIATTVLCVLLGLKCKQIRDRRIALSAIDALGGGYSIRIEGPEWIRKIIGDEKTFYNLGSISLGPICPDYDTNLNFDNVLRDIIPSINKFSDFHSLHIASSPVTDEGLTHLKNLNTLDEINIMDTKVSDSGLEILSTIESLKRLVAFDTEVTANGVAKFQRNLPNCHVVWERK